MKNSAPFVWIGEHRCLDFVNTQMMIEGELTDLLGDFADVVRWLQEAELASEAEASLLSGDGEDAALARDAALAQVRELRAVLRSMIEGVADGQGVSPEVVAHINRFLARRVGHFQLEARGDAFQSVFQSVMREPVDVVARLAGVAADFLTEADWSRVKKCGNPACVLLFLDTTKSRTRRWCSMGLCGNRHKVAAHYARQKSAN